MGKSSIQQITEASLEKAVQVVKSGGLIVVPTDTVYGIACNPFDPQAIDKLFEVKHRPRSKSIQVLLPDLSTLENLYLSLPHPLEILSEAFLPGGLSPIALADSSSELASIRRDVAADGSVRLSQAIRVPDSEPLHTILSAVGPLAATSANLSGHESATNVQQAYEALGDGVELFLDAGRTPGPVSSTVVMADSRDAQGISILRKGVIPETVLRDFLRAGGMPKHTTSDDAAPTSADAAVPGSATDILGSVESTILASTNNSVVTKTEGKETHA